MLFKSSAAPIPLVGAAAIVAVVLFELWRRRRNKEAELAKEKQLCPIVASGIWRTEEGAVALRALRKAGYEISTLSQDLEASYESRSVVSMLRAKGVDVHSKRILAAGTGKGSSQFVLFENGQQTTASYAKGYENEAPPDYSTKQTAVQEILAELPDGTAPSLVVAWGSVWYVCKKNCPVTADKADLRSPEPAETFSDAGWIVPEIKGAPMMVIRNVDMGNGVLFKPHWDVPSETGKYIDLGSGKAARVGKGGVQEENIVFDTKEVIAGKHDEVEGVLRRLLDP